MVVYYNNAVFYHFITEEDVKICLSEILKVKRHLLERNYILIEKQILFNSDIKIANAKSVTDIG